MSPASTNLDQEYIEKAREMVRYIEWVITSLGETNPLSEDRLSLTRYRISQLRPVLEGSEVFEPDMPRTRRLVRAVHEAFEQFIQDEAYYSKYPVPE